MEEHPVDHSDLDLLLTRLKHGDTIFPREHMADQHPSENQLHNEGSLCEGCKNVDWSSLPTLAADGLMETKNLNLLHMNANAEKLKNSSCRVCGILSTMHCPEYDGKQCVLKASPLSRQISYNGTGLSHGLLASKSTVLSMNLERGKSQICTGNSLAVMRLDDLGASKVQPSTIDYDRLRGLMRFCEKEHKACATEPGLNVPGLEVIDTKTCEVVKAPDDCKYLALSYVWGKDEDNESAQDIRHSPPVIRDAISVTNSMGYSYLWVDRYCISDSDEKVRMISQMDQIYAKASFTIIAAADGDTELGLCGVSMPRQLQRVVDVQDVALLELPSVSADLTSSKWASRGWTYQESFLARRRLIFTKTQVLFLCNAVYAAEALMKLLRTSCVSHDTWKFNHLLPRFKDKRRRLSPRDLLSQIEQYSKRHLTRSTDSLNAILGVLNYYAKTSVDFESPILSLPWGLIANKPAKNTFNMFLFWYHQERPTRRTDFPSWSWAGWAGPLTFWLQAIVLQPDQTIEERPLSYLDWKVSMRDADGSTLNMYYLVWEEFEARKLTQRLSQPGPRQLQVTCLVIPVRLQDFYLAETQKQHETKISIHDTGELFSSGRNLPNGTIATLQVWEGICGGVDSGGLHLDQQVEQRDCILGLLCAGRDEELGWTSYRCLLARQIGSKGLYERIGALDVSELSAFAGPFERHQRVYCDAMGNILDNIKISDSQRRNPYAETAERRTVCLV